MSDGERFPRNGSSPGAVGLNWLLLILVILLVAYIVRSPARFGPSRLLNPNAPDKPVVARGDLAEDEKATIEIFQKASPSVVNITNLAVRRNLLSLDVTGVPQGTGSGVVWDQAGYVVTNYHVIASAQAALVTLADGSEWEARIVGSAESKDLAILKIEAPPETLHPISIGTSANLLVGQKVFAIGNPFGLDQTLTTGVVSQTGREILSLNRRPIQGVIQTNAAINPGNSGGPLLDSAGLMIGLNTAIYSPSGVSAGIGFAVPVDTIAHIVPQLIRFGKEEQIGLGITIWDDSTTSRLGLRGVLVREVFEGSPAASAGILPTREDATGRTIPGDLIVALDEKPVKSSVDLFRALDRLPVGADVTMTVRRGNGEKKLPVTLRVVD
ncbi:MAG: S1C family serine protease [Planctomycetaceae bacterium]